MAATDVPSILSDRLQSCRAELGADDVELGLAATARAHTPGTTVLLPGVLPESHADVVGFLSAMRAAQTGPIRLRILDEEHPLQSAGRLRRLSRGSATVEQRRVVEAVRESGWTVGSVERITVDDDSSRLWVDLVAVDIAVMVDASDERERNQGSE